MKVIKSLIALSFLLYPRVVFRLNSWTRKF